jgi:hypothetical protein
MRVPVPKTPEWGEGRRWPAIVVDGPHEGLQLEVYAGQTVALSVTEAMRSLLDGERVYEVVTSVIYEPSTYLGEWSIDDAGRYRYHLSASQDPRRIGP